MISRRQFSTGAAIVLGSAITGCLNNSHASPPSIVVDNGSDREQKVTLILDQASGKNIKKEKISVKSDNKKVIENFFPSAGEFKLSADIDGRRESTMPVEYEADSKGEIRGGTLVTLIIDPDGDAGFVKGQA